MPATAEDTYDVVILGGGSGGYACAFRAAELGMRVALRPESQDRDLLARQRGYVGVLLVVDRRHLGPLRHGVSWAVPRLQTGA